MSALKKAMLREQVQRVRIEKFIENAKKTATAKRTRAFYEVKLEELKQLWAEYKEADQVLTDAYIRDESDSSAALEDTYVQLESKYSEYRSELLEGHRKYPAADSQPTQSGTSPMIRTETFLPKIGLPKFDGNYDSWFSFHDLFVSLIHNNAQLSPVQKLYHLKSCLIGEAEQLLRHIPVTDDNYVKSWEKVKARYENKRILVNHYLKVLLNQSKIASENSTSLQTFISTTDDCLQQITNLKIDVASWDLLLIHILISKLPFVTMKMWEEEQGASQTLPTYKAFHAFLCKRHTILESIADIVSTNQQPQLTRTKPTTRVHHTVKGNQCPVCQEGHWLQRCPKFISMDTTARRRIVRTKGHCYNCLSKDHMTNQCKSKYKCLKCKEKHHTTLHEDAQNRKSYSDSTSTQQQPRDVSTTTSQLQQHQTGQQPNDASIISHQRTTHKAHSAGGSNDVQAFIARKGSHTLLSTALVLTRGSNGRQFTIRCLVDTGSQSSFIIQSTCKKLGVTCSPAVVNIHGLNTIPTGTSTKQTRIILEARNTNKFQMSQTFLVVNKITEKLPKVEIPIKEYDHLHGLELADPGFWKPGNIDALLGADAYARIIQDGVCRGSEPGPVAINTSLGWIVVGPTCKTPNTTVNNFTIQITNEDLSCQLKQFWEEEEITAPPMISEEEQECADHYTKTHKRIRNGQYQVNLPFKRNQEPNLGDSRGLALKRLYCVERRLNSNPQLRKDYEACLQEYIQLGHMVETSPPRDGEANYYIPHHAVIKESSTTTKLRVVFDASAKTTNGNSLNDSLLSGPSIQPKLFCTLLKWRKHRIAVHADIEKMYRMIKIAPEHQTYQRILWRHPSRGNIQDYMLTTATFGTTAAPYLAIRTLNQLAVDEKQNFPLAAKVTESDFYVDDLLTGTDTVDEALELQGQLLAMLKSGGFNIRKWSSNEKQLLEQLPQEYREHKELVTFSEANAIKTLGVRWQQGSDHFSYQFTLPKERDIITKRTILSDVASLYDPLGFLQPIIIVAKMLIQDLWLTGCSWDQPVLEQIEKEWRKYKEDLHNINEFKIPRWIHYSPQYDMQIHGFCDASRRATAAVIYLRVTDTEGNIKSTLLTSRTKVASIKPVTIPRLELNSALLLARLLKESVASMELQGIPLIAWTDSTIVLQWIRQHASKWKTYVANRVVQIQELVTYDLWRHVPTQSNPADLASRGTTVSSLIKNHLWLHGPSWLTKSPKDWPTRCIGIDETTLESKEHTMALVNTNEDEILSKYSSFTRTVRIVAMLRRFINNLKDPVNKQTQAMTTAELNQAELTILRRVQQSAFYSELRSLRTNKRLSPNSKLLTLNPFIDKHGLIRVGGRLKNAAIAYTQKHPVVLPRDHHVTDLIIDKTHRETLHGGISLVLATTRNKYWILDGRRRITSRLHKCVPCTRYRQSTSQQLMGNLPQCRITMAKPFTYTGVDYAGPFDIKPSKHRNAKIYKGYVCVFVCMSTKAIHVELASDLTAEAFVAAFKRFIARRGKCTDMESSPVIGRYLADLSINWHFNPPAAPHFGGLWEAGVKSIKYHLKRTMGNSSYTFEEFTTVLHQIEACLNSRPLCYLSNNADDPFVLTPGHFLIGQSLLALPEPEGNSSLNVRWQHTKCRMTQFWDKWSKDYLNQLQQRSKWQQQRPNLQLGQLVLMKGDSTPPAVWPIGVIEELFPGNDGLTRVVQIRTNAGQFKRPITKMCPLPINTSTHNQQSNTVLHTLNSRVTNNILQMGNRYECEDEGYWDNWQNYLYIDEEVALSPPPVDGLTSPPNQSPQRSTAKAEYPQALPEQTRYTMSKVANPANINGRKITSLRILRPTSTLKELKTREDNEFQRFRTREGTDIYLPKQIIKKLDIGKIRSRKGKEQTLNLPGRYQVKVKVKGNGEIQFHHYHKRGVSRGQNC